MPARPSVVAFDVLETLFSLDGLRSRLDAAGLPDTLDAWFGRLQPYRHAAALCAVVPASMALVAVHGWDVHGARAAGLVTGWASRLECRWPASMKRPDVTGDTLPDVVDGLLALIPS